MKEVEVIFFSARYSIGSRKYDSNSSLIFQIHANLIANPNVELDTQTFEETFYPFILVCFRMHNQA